MNEWKPISELKRTQIGFSHVPYSISFLKQRNMLPSYDIEDRRKWAERCEEDPNLPRYDLEPSWIPQFIELKEIENEIYWRKITLR